MSDENMFYCSFVSIHYIICECGETFPSEEDLKTHLEREHALKKERKEYKCGVCESLFSTEEAAIEHYENSHINVKIEEVVYQGADDDLEEFEGQEVEDNGGIIIQEIYESAPIVTIKSEPVQRKKEKKPKSYYNMKNIMCEVCGKQYASNAALKYHQRVHTGERPYKCTTCDKSFTMPLFLQIHLRTHTGERPYVCSMCTKAFSNKAALLRHDRVHTGVKPYECSECGKFFTQSNSMKLHVNTVHLKMPAPYKSKTRKNKAKEREQIRQSMAVMKTEEQSEDDSIAQEPMTLQFIKPEVHDMIYKQEIEEEAEVGEILYEDVDSREVTYEVVYENDV